MDLLKYKKLLKKNNIQLFDYELRISHYKITNINTEQIGGGKRKSLIHRLKKLDNNNILNIVKLSLSSNPQMILNFI